MDKSAATLRFSSKDFAPEDRVAMLCDLLGRAHMNLDFEFLTEDFSFDAVLWELPGIAVTSGIATPYKCVTHQPAAQDGAVVLAGGWGGDALLRWRGRDAPVGGNGRSTMLRQETVAWMQTATGFVPRVLSVQASMIEELVPDVDDRLLRSIPGSHPAIQLLDAYLPIVCRADVMRSPSRAQEAADNICDLVALAAGTGRDARHRATARGFVAARSATVMHRVEQLSSNCDLSLERVARDFAMSPRTLQEVFHEAGTSFSDFLLARRLEQAHRALLDREQDHLSITTLAFDAGFNDLSYFDRRFKARYGCTPSDVRANAQRD